MKQWKVHGAHAQAGRPEVNHICHIGQKVKDLLLAFHKMQDPRLLKSLDLSRCILLVVVAKLYATAFRVLI